MHKKLRAWSIKDRRGTSLAGAFIDGNVKTLRPLPVQVVVCALPSDRRDEPPPRL